ncbi:unnamed protein product, partial [marine sediment metagenome]
ADRCTLIPDPPIIFALRLNPDNKALEEKIQQLKKQI